MSSYKEMFDQMKKIVGLHSKEKFFDAKLADGITLISIGGEKLEPGLTADLLAEDGSLSPMEDGEYTLETGEIILVKGGLIDQIVPVEDPAVADMKTETPELKERPKAENVAMEAITSKLEILMKKIEELEANLKEQNNAATKLSKLVDIIGKTPSDNPVVKVEPAQFKTEKEIKKQNNKEELSAIISKVNNRK